MTPLDQIKEVADLKSALAYGYEMDIVLAAEALLKRLESEDFIGALKPGDIKLVAPITDRRAELLEVASRILASACSDGAVPNDDRYRKSFAGLVVKQAQELIRQVDEAMKNPEGE